MHIVLVSDQEEATNIQSLGLGYLVAYAKKYSKNTDAKYTILNQRPKNSKEILRHQPDIVGFTSMSLYYNEIDRLAKEIKEQDIPTFIGGHHISILPETLTPNFDFAVIGEGEETFRSLVDSEFKVNSKFLTNELIEPLDAIPFPDRDAMNLSKYLHDFNWISTRTLKRGTSMITSRGCPNKCAFCSASAFWHRYREHSAEYVIDEIQLLYDRYKCKGLLIYDDFFTANVRRLMLIKHKLRERELLGEISYACLARADKFTDDIAKLLVDIGVESVSFGFESSSNRILKYLKGDSASVELNQRAVDICYRNGLDCIANIIIGSPMETDKDLELTYNFVKSNLDRFGGLLVHQATAYPETQFWSYAKEHGINYDIGDLDYRVKHRQVLCDASVDFEKWYSKFNDLQDNKVGVDVPFSWSFCKFAVKRLFVNPKDTMQKVVGKLKEVI